MKRAREIASVVCGLIAAAFLTAMMLLTVADVALRAIGAFPIRGVYELIELLLAGTVFMALPAVFLRDENIVVNAIDDIAPNWVPVLRRLAECLAIVILGIMFWQGLVAAKDSYEFNDQTAELGLPRVWHYSALLVGVALSAIAALVMALRKSGRP